MTNEGHVKFTTWEEAATVLKQIVVPRDEILKQLRQTVQYLEETHWHIRSWSSKEPRNIDRGNLPDWRVSRENVSCAGAGGI